MEICVAADHIVVTSSPYFLRAIVYFFVSCLTCRDFFAYSALDAPSFVASYSQLVFQDDMLSFSRQGTRIAVMNIFRTNCNKQFDHAKFDLE